MTSAVVRHHFKFSGLLVTGLTAGLYGQSAQAPQLSSSTAYYAPSRVPPPLRNQFSSLGDRFQKPGKERLTQMGVLLDSSGTPAQVQLVIQSGGRLRIDWIGNPSKSIVFNGSTATVSNTASVADALLESLVDDLPDSFMVSAAQGMGFRLVGRRFRNATSGLCDFYDAPTPPLANTKQRRTTKRYCFDSTTLLLKDVLYPSGATPNSPQIDTRFSNWQNVNGQAIPGRVTRFLGATTVFDLQLQNNTVSPAAPDGLFGP